jgi:uncharacterized protein YggT (Ycf19 family)
MQYYILIKVYQGIEIFLRILQYVLVAYCVLSWIASPINRLYVLLSRIAQPLLAPFRRLSSLLFQRGLRIDTSAIFAILALSVVQQLITWLFRWLVSVIL